MKTCNHIAVRIAAVIAICLAAVSCEKIKHADDEPEVKDRVLLYYAAGFNDLYPSLQEDIDQLCSEGYIPTKTSGNVLLVFQNLAKKIKPEDNPYVNPATPTLFRVYRDSDGKIVRNIELELEPGTLAASVNTLNQILTYVNSTWKSDSYGMIFSSHATGWLPAARKENPSYSTSSASPSSIGNEYDPWTLQKYEMDLVDFAQAIPMHLDYILFDACFMGGVEVAYQLKDVCDRIAFSQAEVLADGFDYTTMASFLLEKDADLYGVCKTYYEHYNSLSGEYQSATVSLVDCSGMDALAQACKEIYSSHRAELDMINPDNVQCFGRFAEHLYFYDLEDIMNQLNLSNAEKSSFDSAMDECIIYKATTGRMIEIRIDEFCGLSSYCTNKFTYDDFYKTLSWNEATGMIR